MTCSSHRHITSILKKESLQGKEGIYWQPGSKNGSTPPPFWSQIFTSLPQWSLRRPHLLFGCPSWFLTTTSPPLVYILCRHTAAQMNFVPWPCVKCECLLIVIAKVIINHVHTCTFGTYAHVKKGYFLNLIKTRGYNSYLGLHHFKLLIPINIINTVGCIIWLLQVKCQYAGSRMHVL